MPKVTIDGKDYTGVSTVTVGGKTLSLAQEYSGNKTISANGTNIDVSGLATVTVNVPSAGISPSGTKSITANGTYDVTQYASASVNVPTGGGSGNHFTYGKLVVDAVSDSITIQTGLSAITGFLVFAESPSSGTTYTNYWFNASTPDSAASTRGRIGYNSSQYFSSAAALTTQYYSKSGGALTLKKYGNNSIPAGTYYWVAW